MTTRSATESQQRKDRLLCEARASRILVVTQYFWPESFKINDLVANLVERGNEVVVLTGIPNYPSGQAYPGYSWRGRWNEDYRGAKVIRVPHMVRGPGTGARLTGNYLSYAIGASLFGIGRCGRRFDLIFVYEPSPITVAIPGILASRLHRAPLVMWVQDLWPDVIAALVGNIGQFGFALLDKFTRWIYRNCDLLLTASLGFVHRLQEQGVDPRRIKYIPNWAEPVYRPIDPDAVTISRDDIPQGFVVMFAGNLGESQSLETVISAVESVPVDAGIKWVFIGDGRRRQWMAGEVSRRKIDDRVVILPRKPIDKMPEYFCLADVLLVTLRDERLYELTVPSKLQTYLACARPILAALNGEGARIIKDSRAGEVVPAGDSRALAEAVQRLAALSKTERNQMGDRGYQFFLEHFERERVLTRVYRLLDEAMACK